MTDCIVLVNAVRTGAPFRAAAAQTGLAVVGAYTFPEAIVEDVARMTMAELKDGMAATYFDATPERMVEWLKRDGLRARAVIPATEPGVVCADRLGALLGVPCNDPEIALARRDKAAMRAAVTNAGLRCPPFVRAEDHECALEFVRQHGFPVMVKTPAGASMNHVYRCADEPSVTASLAAVLANENLFGEKTLHAVVEGFVPGEEYAVNGFHDGERIHITDVWHYERRDTRFARGLYWAAIMLPPDDPRVAALAEYGKEVAHAVGVRVGPFHAEVKLAPEPTVIEIGARLFGIEAPIRMVESSNFDPYRATVDVFLNGRTTVPEPVKYRDALACAFLINEAEGWIEGIEGTDQIQALPSFRTWMPKAKIGNWITPTIDMETPPILVWLRNPDRAKMLSDLQTVHDVYRVDAKLIPQPGRWM